MAFLFKQGSAMGRFSDFKASFLEILWITKTCLTTFWFWLPISLMVYLLIQVWMVFFIHPFTLVILPAVMIVYGTILEEKRVRLRYGLDKPRRFQVSHGLGAPPEPMAGDEWKVEQAVDQYRRLLEHDDEDKHE